MERNFDIVSMNIAEKRPLLSSRRFLGEQQNENIGNGRERRWDANRGGRYVSTTGLRSMSDPYRELARRAS